MNCVHCVHEYVLQDEWLNAFVVQAIYCQRISNWRALRNCVVQESGRYSLTHDKTWASYFGVFDKMVVSDTNTLNNRELEVH